MRVFGEGRDGGIVIADKSFLARNHQRACEGPLEWSKVVIIIGIAAYLSYEVKTWEEKLANTKEKSP